MQNPYLIGIVIGLAIAWAYHAFAVPKGAPAFPVFLTYDKIGQAVDRLGVPFNQANPGR